MLNTYRPEFRFLTISGWNREHLGELGLDVEVVSPGVDLETFRPLEQNARRDDMVLALGRSDPLKNLPSPSRRGGGWLSRVPNCACSATSPSSPPTPESAT